MYLDKFRHCLGVGFFELNVGDLRLLKKRPPLIGVNSKMDLSPAHGERQTRTESSGLKYRKFCGGCFHRVDPPRYLRGRTNFAPVNDVWVYCTHVTSK